MMRSTTPLKVAPERIPCGAASVILACLICAILLALPAHAREVDQGREFLSRYEPALRRIEDAYSHLQLKFTLSITLEAPGEPTDVREGFAGTNQRLAMVRYRFVGRTDDKSVEESVTVANPNHSFRLEHRPGEEWVEVSSPACPSALEYIRRNAKVMVAPFGLFGLTLAKAVSDPSMQIKTIEQSGTGIDEVTTVAFKESLPHADGEGHFRFASGKGWVLLDYKCHSWNPGKRESDGYGSLNAAITYEGDVDGIPLVASARYWTEINEPGSSEPFVRALEEYKVTSVVRAPLPEDQFVLAAYGLGAPGSAGSASTRWNFVSVIVLIVLVIAMILVYRQSQHSRKSQ